MLCTLTIRDFVLIKNLTIQFSSGLCALTGETGAGKSILLDALGLALGNRGEGNFVAPGATRASISAEFELSPTHPIFKLAETKGLGLNPNEGFVILRRFIGSDGRSKGFINDQPVTIGTLRDLGDSLIEIHGQHDDRGLLNSWGHRTLLDAFGGHDQAVKEVSIAFQNLQEIENEVSRLQTQLEKQEEEEEFNRHCLEELNLLNPEVGEEEELAATRKLMLEGEKSGEALSEILDSLDTEEGVEMALRRAIRRLERLSDNLKTLLEPALEALAKAATETEEGIGKLRQTTEALNYNPEKLEQTEARLFEIRGLARKHQCHPDDLPQVRREFEEKVSGLAEGTKALKAAQENLDRVKRGYEKLCQTLTKARQETAKKLDKGVESELRPLKLEKAKFKTVIEPLPREKWGPEGSEKVAFEVSTNPGAPFGPLIKIASGGELSRFILALKVVLASAGSAPTLIFDEVDRGVGGAVADAVGERLFKLSDEAQVLVVTHSPQVAARAATHFVVGKKDVKGAAETTLSELNSKDRREEIARMLSGAKITDKARAAAESLIEGGT